MGAAGNYLAGGQLASCNEKHRESVVSATKWPAWPDQQQRQWFVDGVRTIAPVTVAVGLWGFVTGVAMIKAGMTTYAASWMSLLVYASCTEPA